MGRMSGAVTQIRVSAVVLMLLVTLATGHTQSSREKTLDIVFIDVEGGQATLFVSPSGESMLIDAGWPGFDGRDADRIAAAASAAGVSRIDYLVITHYHRDHVGGVPQLAAKLPIGRFVDHGPNLEREEGQIELAKIYDAVRKDAPHMVVAPGDRIPIAGLDVRVVSAAGEVLQRALPGGGTANPLCRAFVPRDPDSTENARSLGVVVQYGRFRALDLGDLTWNKERDLVCPSNLLGPIDVYLTTHHGLSASGPPVIVHALAPRVAVMNNGARKGGSRETWQIVRDSPGLQDIWQLHYAIEGGPAHNAPASFIANLDETTAHTLRVSAGVDGGFVVTNERLGFSKRYPPRP
jgi:competence protein ComEC